MNNLHSSEWYFEWLISERRPGILLQNTNSSSIVQWCTQLYKKSASILKICYQRLGGEAPQTPNLLSLKIVYIINDANVIETTGKQ